MVSRTRLFETDPRGKYLSERVPSEKQNSRETKLDFSAFLFHVRRTQVFRAVGDATEGSRLDSHPSNRVQKYNINPLEPRSQLSISCKNEHLFWKKGGGGGESVAKLIAAKKVITETFTTFGRGRTKVHVHWMGPVMEGVIKTKYKG
jgi:hypothetical protein